MAASLCIGDCGGIRLGHGACNGSSTKVIPGEDREDSSELDGVALVPITLEDIRRAPSFSDNEDEESTFVRRKSDHSTRRLPFGKRRRLITLNSDSALWKRALAKVDSLGDAWQNFDVDGVVTETAVRHRYNALTADWTLDHVQLKIEAEQFNSGAMRRCFRAKKLSNFTNKDSWRCESNNFVAKSYIDNVDRQVYFDDVKLQMEAKLWGEEYNRYKPPKKVDIMLMCVVELVDRPGKPLYHLEHFIEGEYVKYNSNSGFVRDENMRLTPQAFSHFTFERSGHQLIVVDVQGVGDLYTDPQIHTADGESYGDGNLGTRGMALFFHSHVCSSICRQLRLTQFDLTSTESGELSNLAKQQAKCGTVLRGGESGVTTGDESDTPLLRQRHVSSPIIHPPHPHHHQHQQLHEQMELNVRHRYSSYNSDGTPAKLTDTNSPVSPSSASSSITAGDSSVFNRFSRRGRCFSTSSNESSDSSARTRFTELILIHSRPSDVRSENARMVSLTRTVGDVKLLPFSDDSSLVSATTPDTDTDSDLTCDDTIVSVLGEVHLELAKYHEVGRFRCHEQTGGGDNFGAPEYDRDAACFHLHCAVQCRHLAAILLLADICLDRGHNLLSDLRVRDVVAEQKAEVFGRRLVRWAARLGHRASMLQTALWHTEEPGPDWGLALLWRQRALSVGPCGGASEGGDEEADYTVLAQCADMYRQGGPGLIADPARAAELYSEAAELAMAAMKGRIANKYFILSEECLSLVED